MNNDGAMSNTPRTDSVAFDSDAYGRQKRIDGDFVEADFTRQLERELAEARAEIIELQKRVAELESAMSSHGTVNNEAKFIAALAVVEAARKSCENLGDQSRDQYLRHLLKHFNVIGSTCISLIKAVDSFDVVWK